MRELRHIKISEARKHIGQIVADVTMNGIPVALDNRNSPQVVMLPYRDGVLDYKTLMPLILSDDDLGFNYFLASYLAYKLLAGAPVHIKEPQVKEFEKLSIDQLQLLLSVESIPLKSSERKKLVKKLGSRIIERLEKRKKIADSIIEAEKEGLYELEEHKTGMMKI